MKAHLRQLCALVALGCLGAGWLGGCSSNRYLHPKTGRAYHEVIQLQARPTASPPEEITAEDAQIVLEKLRADSRDRNNQRSSSGPLLRLMR